MKHKALLKTNLLISIFLVIGFTLTAIFGYKTNYEDSVNNIQQVSSLTAEGIYYQLTTMFTKPVNVSLTMAHDNFLVEHLSEEEGYPDDEEYIRITADYLNAYQRRYGFDSVFLVSAATGRYYNFNGLDRVLTRDDPENTWYYDLVDSGLEYALEVDNNQVLGANDEITVFVNCKVRNRYGKTLGIVGVGIRMDYLKRLLKDYGEKYNLEASLIGGDGTIQISTTHTGDEKVNWFSVHGQESIRRKVLGWNKDTSNLELWTHSSHQTKDKSYVVVRYIPELSWRLVIEQKTGRLIEKMHTQLYHTCAILAAVVGVILVVVTTVIRNFNRQITALVEEQQAIFKKATEQQYDNIYELNLTKNCYVGKRTEEYFESQGAKGLPYDQGLRVIAEKQIQEEFREGYVSTFTPENVIREFEAGNDHLSYDFKITQDGRNYHWMRIDAYIFYSAEDQSIHMFTYRKNIDMEKQRELQAATDEMTGFFTRTATERGIRKRLEEKPHGMYAFFIFDIDNFKQANDRFGHAFGDKCIHTFTETIRRHFREKDILGRIGGDEFAAFIPIPDAQWVKAKAEELSGALEIVCSSGEAQWNMSASIGVAVYPEDGTDFDALYRNADTALYQVKQSGKDSYGIYGAPMERDDRNEAQ